MLVHSPSSLGRSPQSLALTIRHLPHITHHVLLKSIEQADAYERWAMDLLEEADEHATTILLALPLVTADVWGREFNKLWPRSTLEAAHGCGIGDETVC